MQDPEGSAAHLAEAGRGGPGCAAARRRSAPAGPGPSDSCDSYSGCGLDSGWQTVGLPVQSLTARPWRVRVTSPWLTAPPRPTAPIRPPELMAYSEPRNQAGGPPPLESIRQAALPALGLGLGARALGPQPGLGRARRRRAGDSRFPSSTVRVKDESAARPSRRRRAAGFGVSSRCAPAGEPPRIYSNIAFKSKHCFQVGDSKPVNVRA